jgi:hypothetical protein
MKIENYGFVFGVDYDESNVIEIVRTIRDGMLARSDWTQLPDSPLTESQRAEWATYRQALRDITATYADNLLEAEFPDQPGTPPQTPEIPVE